MCSNHISRRGVLATTAGLGTVGLAGCSDGKGGDGGDGEPSRTLIGAFAAEGTVGFTQGQAMSVALQESSSDISLDVQPRGEATLDVASTGEADLAYSNGYTAAQAHDGTGSYEGQTLDPWPHQAFYNHAGNVYLAAREGSGIETVSDLAGERGSLSDNSASFYPPLVQMCKAVGVYDEMDERAMPVGQLADAFSREAIDYAVLSTANNAVTSGYAQELIDRAGEDGYHLIGYTDEEREAISQIGGVQLNEYETKEGFAGASDPETNTSYDIPYGLFASPETSDDVIYEFIDVLWNNKDTLIDSFGLFETWTQEIMFGLISTDYAVHPGAAEWYQDQDWWTDDHMSG